MHITDTRNPQVHFRVFSFYVRGGTQNGIHKNYENFEELQN